MNKQEAQTLRHLIKCFPKTNCFYQDDEVSQTVLVSPGVGYLFRNTNSEWLVSLITKGIKNVTDLLHEGLEVSVTSLKLQSEVKEERCHIAITMQIAPENNPRPDLEGVKFLDERVSSSKIMWPEGEWELRMATGHNSVAPTPDDSPYLLVFLPGEV